MSSKPLLQNRCQTQRRWPERVVYQAEAINVEQSCEKSHLGLACPTPTKPCCGTEKLPVPLGPFIPL